MRSKTPPYFYREIWKLGEMSLNTFNLPNRKNLVGFSKIYTINKSTHMTSNVANFISTRLLKPSSTEYQRE